jgi:hypothetical protein
MGFRPAVFLVAFLVPTISNLDFASVDDRPSNCYVRCTNVSSDGSEAIREHNVQELRWLLFPHGIAVGSTNGSISRAAISQAVAAWNVGIGIHILHPAKPSEIPDIQVEKVSKVDESDELQGQIEIQRLDNGKLAATVAISGVDSGKELSDTAVGAVLTHEIGHFLGLADAPDNAPVGTCVMGEFDADHLALKPSGAEVRTVVQMRIKIRAAISKIASTSK